MTLMKSIGLVLGPAILTIIMLTSPPEGMSPAAWHTAGVALLMATWWATEAMPIAATSLVPIVLFPILGVIPIKAATAPYANPLIFLFLGGFMVAIAMERWSLHRRIALGIIGFVGSHPHAIVLGFMMATALLSMWISNTATTMMMLPIGTSVATILMVEAEKSEPGEANHHRSFAICLMLGIAYAASIGGVGTLIGTPTNLAMASILKEEFGIEIGMAQWSLLGVPFVAVMLPLAWLMLTRVVYPFDLGASDAATNHIEEERRDLGSITVPEKRVAMVAGLVALLWVGRGLSKEFLVPHLEQGAVLYDFIRNSSDAGIAIFGTLILFLMPSGDGNPDDGRDRLMDWSATSRLPWGLILLFGGGLSLAGAMSQSGLAIWISESLAILGAWPLIGLTAMIVLVIVFLTELTSNAATTTAFVPVIGALAIGIGVDPILLAAPAAMAASCAFMLPVATPPNAIVFGSGYLTIPDMVKAGFWMNLVSITIVSLFAWWLLPVVFGPSS
jgi:solute carrier family 13 (sodium-dependent dicarboxylate transporter), member 2/3/5